MTGLYFSTILKTYIHTGLDELAHGAQKEEPVLEHLLCHLRQLSPVQRDMAVHMLHLAFRAAQELGPEE